MKKEYYLLLAFSILQFMANAQSLVQDASENSTIRHNGNTINFDLSQARSSFNLNKIDIKSKNWINFYGVQASAVSKNGVANIINSGTFVPEAAININFGHAWEDQDSKDFKELNRNYERLAEEKGNFDVAFEISLAIRLEAFKGEQLPELNDSKKAELKTKVNNIKLSYQKGDIDQDDIDDKIKELKDIEDFKPVSKTLDEFANSIGSFIINGAKKEVSFPEEIKNAENLIINFEEKIDKFIFYFLAGGKGSKFMYDLGSENHDFSKRFKEKKPAGAKGGIGFNWHHGAKYTFGVNTTWERTDNFVLLEDKEYTRSITSSVTTTTTVTVNSNPPTTVTETKVTPSDKLDEKKVFTAYSNKEIEHHDFGQTSLNFDLVRFYAKPEDDGVFVVNYYLRHQISSNGNVYPNMTNAGVGGYFFKSSGKFTGGLFAEFQDLNNNLEKMKAEPDFKPIYNRIKFGIVAKFSIQSISLLPF